MRIQFYKNWRFQWRWKITAGNNRRIGASTESYHNYKDCENNLRQVGNAITQHFKTLDNGTV